MEHFRSPALPLALAAVAMFVTAVLTRYMEQPTPIIIVWSVWVFGVVTWKAHGIVRVRRLRALCADHRMRMDMLKENAWGMWKAKYPPEQCLQSIEDHALELGLEVRTKAGYRCATVEVRDDSGDWQKLMFTEDKNSSTVVH
jgi:hypothetical protein